MPTAEFWTFSVSFGEISALWEACPSIWQTPVIKSGEKIASGRRHTNGVFLSMNASTISSICPTPVGQALVPNDIWMKMDNGKQPSQKQRFPNLRKIQSARRAQPKRDQGRFSNRIVFLHYSR
jgi:hypothetical protein